MGLEVGKVSKVSYGNSDPVQAIGSHKVKKFQEELAGQLSGRPMQVAYLPDLGGAIGGLLNGKGSGQAATQV